jgi:hypothetical protein
MKTVLIILAAVTTLWIPEYLWAMDRVPDACLLSCPHHDRVYMDIDRISVGPCYSFSGKGLNS